MKLYKKSVYLILFLLVVLSSIILVNAIEDKVLSVNWNLSNELNCVDGKITINGYTTYEKVKVLIDKNGLKTWNDLPLTDGTFSKTIWLVNGIGSYSVSVMTLIDNNKYLYSYGDSITVKNINNQINPFLVPSNNVESDNKEIIEMANKIVGIESNDKEKSKMIYNWVVCNIKYDIKKYIKHLNGDFNNHYGALYTLKVKTGVCYDYATLFAALGRSLGLQVKVITGYSKENGVKKEFHAWNEVYIQEDSRWINVDTTFGRVYRNNYFDNKGFEKDHFKIDDY